jgi:hypothetical protein
MKRALQPQGDGTWLFLQDGEQVWWGQDFVECIEQARLDSIGEVRKMVAREESEPMEVYAYDTSFRKRGAHTLIDFWFRFSLWFKRVVSR